MDCAEFLSRCCALDLETNENNEIFAIAALQGQQPWSRKAPFAIESILVELDQFSESVDFLLGHNLLRHDIPLCKSLNLNLQFVDKAIIDTLFLSPLAFPENPYHRLVKDYKLVRDGLNDPLLDARLAVKLFKDEWTALSENPTLLSFYRYAFADDPQYRGICDAFKAMGGAALEPAQAEAIFQRLCRDKVCRQTLQTATPKYFTDHRPLLAYALAWLQVAGGNSVIPPWVRKEFHPLSSLLSQLRDIPCELENCRYCRATHNPDEQLSNYFGFPAFRPQPATDDGRSLQRQIVRAAMSDQAVFAVLPTGGGKSLCFQLPSLVRYQRRGALTIVISPLQALMKDQVDNLAIKTGSPAAAALYGMLTPPERGEVLKGVQLGDIAILYVSPEQLRNRGFQNAIAQREIGCWVFDEAHCLSKWGHDFRPDYLYAARFIKEFALKHQTPLPPVQCFTATAKQDVKAEILDYFRANLGMELQVFEGGVERDNLQFEVQTVNKADKYPRIHRLLLEYLPEQTENGSAIIYCATQKATENLAEHLQQQDLPIEAFHAGKDNAEKKRIQENFVSGVTRVITATNAFGMGIDKDDVRLVIHADIPGSLENYLQEAGRAGRDRKDAVCILLYDEDDIETQFKLSALSQLTQRDIAQILKGLRKSKKNAEGNVVITSGELLQHEAVDASFDHDDRQAATKVITAVSWLERAGYIERNENRTQVFQGRPKVKDLQEAAQKLKKLNLSQRQQQRWLAILEALFNADSDEAFSADELAQLSEFADSEAAVELQKQQSPAQQVIRTLYDMADAGLIEKNLLLTAFVRPKGAHASAQLLQQVCQLENAMLNALQEQAPDADSEDAEWQALSLRHLNQTLLDDSHHSSNPEQLRKLLNSLSRDGQGLAGERGSLSLRHQGRDQYRVKLQRGWSAIKAIAAKRQAIAQIALLRIIQNIPSDTSSTGDLLVEFSAEQIITALQQDMVIAPQVKDPLAAIERALNFLHEQKVITLQQGLAVFRQAMTIQVLPEAKGRRYNKGDYQPLSQHYGERVFQVHVMNEYAQQALQKIGQALALVVAYFAQDRKSFAKRYFSGRQDIYQRATSQQSFQRIVSDLNNPEQIALVAGKALNQLILAGPGSGKTRVVAHRCAYLLRVQRVPARQLLLLCFNRNAAVELRKRLFDLVGDDAKGVTVQTYHGLALRLTGHAFNVQRNEADESYFENILQEAIALLRGDKELLGMEADENRDRLLDGYQYILVDEYQDIDELQYQLVAAITGRSLDADSQLTIMAVGDDDQNIYQFRGANVRYIRQFEQDYQAEKAYLTENYRSTAHIIAAADQLIADNRDRMKSDHPIRINRERKDLPPGGHWRQIDPLAQGRVQMIQIIDEYQQAQAVMDELQRLRSLDNRLDWRQCAVLAREWQSLNPVRTLLEQNNIPCSIALPADRQPPPFRIRENIALSEALKNHPQPLSRADDWLAFIQQIRTVDNPWWRQLKKLMEEWRQETCNGQVSNQQTLEYLYESLAEQRRERRLGEGVWLSTVHASKGMEFDHLFIVDGGWNSKNIEEQRRLYYVAMTRAKQNLISMQRRDRQNPFINKLQGDFMLRRSGADTHRSAGEFYQYAFIGLQDLHLSYPAQFSEKNPIHQRLSKLVPGDSLSLRQYGGKIAIIDQDIRVGQLSKQAAEQWLKHLGRIVSIQVIAMVRRYREDNEEKFQQNCRVEQWEVPMLEVKLKM